MRSFYKMTDSFSNILKEICQKDGESLWEDITGNDDNPFVRKERSYSWLQWDGKTQEPVLCGADFDTDRTDILPVSCLNDDEARDVLTRIYRNEYRHLVRTKAEFIQRHGRRMYVVCMMKLSEYIDVLQFADPVDEKEGDS